MGGLPGMKKVGLPATKSDIQPSRTGRVSLNSRDLCACSYLAAAIAGQQGRAGSGEYSRGEYLSGSMCFAFASA